VRLSTNFPKSEGLSVLATLERGMGRTTIFGGKNPVGWGRELQVVARGTVRHIWLEQKKVKKERSKAKGGGAERVVL